MQTVYVVMAFRYGTNENVFPIAVCRNRHRAVKYAREHHNYRGGKYEHRIYPLILDGAWDDMYCAGGPALVEQCQETESKD